MNKTLPSEYDFSTADGADRYLRDHPERIGKALPLSVFLCTQPSVQSRVALLLSDGICMPEGNLHAIHLLDEMISLMSSYPYMRGELVSILENTPGDADLLIAELQKLRSSISFLDPLGR